MIASASARTRVCGLAFAWPVANWRRGGGWPLLAAPRVEFADRCLTKSTRVEEVIVIT
jgi:hypothetical protein